VKWVGLVILLVAIFPLSSWLRRNPSQAPKVWLLFGLTPFLITVAHLVMAVRSVDIPNEYHAQGLEFSAFDALAIALYLSSPRGKYSLPFRFEMTMYFVAVFLSIFQSFAPQISFFYAWQLLRMFLVYAVAARGCGDMRVVKAVLLGMAIGLIFEAAISVLERFSSGAIQASGTFDHQNMLGLVSHLVVFPFFVAFLNGFWGLFPAFVVFSGLVVVLLTASRATLGLAAIGYVVTFAASALGSLSSRKLAILGVAIVAFFVLVPVAISAIEKRGVGDIEASDEARGSMERAAAMMLADHPLGVGANTYIQAANMGGYNSAAKVDFTSWVVFVHNVYWVIAVETGYLGLVTFVIMLLRPIIVAFVCGFRHRRDSRGQLLLGLGVALLMVTIHGLFEWIVLKAIPQYFLAIEFGMVAGLARQLGYWGRSYSQNAAVAIAPGRLAGNSTGHKGLL
jgi:O-antigen ligase